MRKAPLRDNEVATLETLHDLQILDTAADPEFDVLVNAASKICNMPMALISLVDEHRQWFKARTGLPDISETPRDIAFCAHAVLEQDVFEIPDTHLDARFADNPMVEGSPGIRFYAGAPLCIADGLRIGTLCIMDTLPRRLSAQERQLLKNLATAVVHSIEGRFVQRRSRMRYLPGSTRGLSTIDLVLDAMATVEVALERLFDGGSRTSSSAQADLMAMGSAESADDAKRAAYQAQHAVTAMHFCLTGSSGLLGITHDLLASNSYKTPLQQERAWKQLAADSKIAGRAAYRAALALVDPLADRAFGATDSAPG